MPCLDRGDISEEEVTIDGITKTEMNNKHTIEKFKACVRAGPVVSKNTKCPEVVNQICSDTDPPPECRTWVLSMQK